MVASLAGKYPDHLGHLTTPRNSNRPASLAATGLLWGADNGCYTGLDVRRYRQLLAKLRGLPRCLFVVVPDIVGDAKGTLALWGQWQEEVRETAGQPLAFVGQDGAEDLDLPWGGLDAWFVGGSTRWKLSEASADLACEAKRRGKWLHMGRVNTLRRLETAFRLGCDSVDGSCFSRWSDKFLEWAIRHVRWLEAAPAWW